jgi:uncharacterized protein (DUF1501 family)
MMKHDYILYHLLQQFFLHSSIFFVLAWGGNYFVAGGEIEGKRILGSYPDTLSEDGPLVFEPGIVIPEVPWDALWNGVAQWIGITNSVVSNFVII